MDIVVAQGHEAGGHTGEIGSVVLWPEIVDALGGRAQCSPRAGSVSAAGGGRPWRWERPEYGWVRHF